MQRSFFWLVVLVFASGTNWGVDYENDLLLKGRSDPAIKYLTPPMSLTIIQNRPQLGSYYFFEGENKRFDDDLKGKFLERPGKSDAALNGSTEVGKILLKTDPARLTPARQGSDHRGPITRNALEQLAENNRADLLLVFRREIKFEPGAAIPLGSFLNPENLLADDDKTFKDITLKTKGLVYITQQKKVLALKENSQHGNDLKDMAQRGAKELAKEAKKVIQAQKKVITKSY